MQDLVDVCNDLNSVLDQAANLCKIMLKPDIVHITHIDRTMDTLAANDVNISFPYRVRQFKCHVAHAQQYSDYVKIMQLCDRSSSPLLDKLSDNGFDEAQCQSLVMSTVEQITENLLNNLTTQDISKGGPSKMRLVACVQAACSQSRA